MYKCRLCRFSALFYIFKRLSLVENLYDRFCINAVDRTVSALADQLTSFNGHFTERTADVQYLSKACDVKDLIDLAADIIDCNVTHSLCQLQKGTESCTGYVL